jgi:hypothetical protein
MASLPLGLWSPARHARGMAAHSTWFAGLARRAGHAVNEMNYATSVLLSRRLSCGMPETDRAPDNFTEFLLRCPGTSRREPSARRRVAGSPVR